MYLLAFSLVRIGLLNFFGVIDQTYVQHFQLFGARWCFTMIF